MRKVNLSKALAGARQYIESLRETCRKQEMLINNLNQALDDACKDKKFFENSLRAALNSNSELLGIAMHIDRLRNPTMRAESHSHSAIMGCREKTPEEKEFDKYCQMDVR